MESNRGSITIFMTFVLFIMLGFICFMLEITRYYEMKAFTKECIHEATDATLTEYYRPLFEDYHVFFMVRGNQTADEFVGEKVNDYLEYMLYPSKENKLWDFTLSKLKSNLVAPQMINRKVEEVASAVDNGGKYFEKEAISYMQYREVGLLKDKIAELLGFSDNLTKTSEVMQAKVQAEEKVGELDKYVLRLMELIEGIEVNKNGIKCTKDGRVKTKEYFSKRFVPCEITQQNLCINNTIVWTSLKQKYINVNSMIKRLSDMCSSLPGVIRQLEVLDEKIQQFEIPEGTEKEEQQEKLRELGKLSVEREELLEEKNRTLLEIEEIANGLYKTADQIKGCNERSIVLIKELKSKREQAKGDVHCFKEKLENNEESMDKETYEGLKDDHKRMEQYIGEKGDTSSYMEGIIKMEPILQENSQILDSIIELSGYLKGSTNCNYDTVNQQCKQCIKELENYKIKELSFDYSSLKVNEDVENPIDKMKSMLKGNLAELTLPEGGQISKKNMSQPDYLWKRYKANEKDGNEETTYSIKDSMKEIDNGSAYEVFEQTSEENIGSDILEAIHFVMYLKEHFKSFTAETGQEKELIRRLDYELEYLLKAKKSDKENLYSTINQLIGIRTILNFLSIVVDKEKGALAYETAAALVGMTGLAPLIELTKTMILIVWSFDEALVDVAALLNGASIPLFKSSKEFVIQYTDLLIMNKNLIQQKAKKYIRVKSGIGNMSYEDYITIFLIMQNRKKGCYRAMDLINGNMKLRYDENFNIEHTIYGFLFTGEFQSKERFLLLPTTKLLQLNKELQWKFNMSSYNCYS